MLLRENRQNHLLAVIDLAETSTRDRRRAATNIQALVVQNRVADRRHRTMIRVTKNLQQSTLQVDIPCTVLHLLPLLKIIITLILSSITPLIIKLGPNPDQNRRIIIANSPHLRHTRRQVPADLIVIMRTTGSIIGRMTDGLSLIKTQNLTMRCFLI